MHSFNKTPYYNNNRELPGLQFLKFICAILVVQLHSYSFLWSGLVPICRIAVPVFFFISGYFMVSAEGTISEKKIISTAKKILRITIIANLAYIAYDFLMYLKFHEELNDYSNPDYWICIFVYGYSGMHHLWYLTAYLQILLLIYILLKLNIFKIFLPLMPFCILLNLLQGSYSYILFDSGSPFINLEMDAVTLGIPCVAIGILLRIYEHLFPSQKVILGCLIVAIPLLYLEHVINHDYTGDLLIMTIPVAILTFIYFLRYNPVSWLPKLIATLGKHQSLNIYLWHMMMAGIYVYIEYHLGIDHSVESFAVILLTVAVSIIFNPISLPERCLKLVRKITA
ncbi:MAG: acyltransferase family protein [Candidatus Amulumruptor caecigallinarius]|nr:acyltransferase family protein [Candidatus Amulumruptor caecigallinarius]